MKRKGTMVGSLRLLVYVGLFYLAIFSPVSGDIFHKSEQKIIVQNRAGNKQDIWVHCWSKDDDLGVHRLQYWQTFVIKFHPSILLNTMFLCTVTWDNINPKGTRTQHTIVVYKWKFDEELCGPDPYQKEDWPGCIYRIGLFSFEGHDGLNPWNVPSRRLLK